MKISTVMTFFIGSGSGKGHPWFSWQAGKSIFCRCLLKYFTGETTSGDRSTIRRKEKRTHIVYMYIYAHSSSSCSPPPRFDWRPDRQVWPRSMGFSFSGRSPVGSPKPRPRATLHRWRRPCRRQIGHACFHVWTQGAFLTFKRLSFFQPMTPHSLLFQWHAAKFQQFNLIRFFVWPNLRSKCKIHWGFLLHSPCSPCENVILLIWWWIKLSRIEYWANLSIQDRIYTIFSLVGVWKETQS